MNSAFLNQFIIRTLFLYGFPKVRKLRIGAQNAQDPCPRSTQLMHGVRVGGLRSTLCRDMAGRSGRGSVATEPTRRGVGVCPCFTIEMNMAIPVI